jgi:signal transduction histidine kinase/CheY-like chemotaxis protein
MAITPDRNIWIPTSFGLTRYDIQHNKYDIYANNSGLPENGLNAVVVDHNDRIWVSGDQFIAKFNPATETFKTYNTVRNIKSFWSKSRFLAPDGRIYFGGIDGVYTFHPDSIHTDLTAPRIILTDFKIRNKTHLLDNAFENVSEIALTHDQNDIAFTFTGIHLIEPASNQYRCMLEGYEDAWRALGHQHSVNYTNLNPGDYVFRVQAANRDGIWSTEDLSIDLSISPPFTQTTWFRAMLTLVFVLLAYAILRIWYYQQQLRRQKKIAEQTSEYRMQFLSHVSHEIRTPMNAIIGLSGLAVETNLNPQQRRYLAAIEQSSKDLLKIINQLLDHSKLESGMFSFDYSPFIMTSVTEQLEAMLKPLAEAKGLVLQINIAPEVPLNLKGDALRLTQILTNLLGNAIKFTEHGQVSLKISSEPTTSDQAVVTFEVSDTGMGISPDMLDSVFDQFVDQQKGPSAPGTGLGLFISRQLVERQHGTIDIRSVVDEGTCVTVRLPFEVTGAEGAGARKASPVSSGQAFGEIRILVVDDAAFNLLVVTEMIKKRIPNASVITAESGMEALELLQTQPCDVIVMDVKMPGMDGHETTRAIRAMKDDVAHIPILGATAGAMPAQIQACMDSGMNDVITKPIDVDTLIEKLFLLTQKQVR